MKRFTSRTKSPSRIPKVFSNVATVQTAPFMSVAPSMSVKFNATCVVVPSLNFSSGAMDALI